VSRLATRPALAVSRYVATLTPPPPAAGSFLDRLA
jgi:hypothetical protein